MAYIGREPQIGNFQVCDAISVVNGQAAYTMQVNSVNVSPETANHVLCSVNGILQRSGSSFTVSGSTITFASNLVTGDVIDFIHILGSVLDLGVPSNDTVGAAQIKDDLISGTTALATAPDDTDEFLVSDAGTLKRIDYSLIKGGGAYEKLLTTTASNDANVAFSSTYITSTHRDYKIVMSDIIAYTGGQNLFIYFSDDNGSSYFTTNQYSSATHGRNSSNAASTSYVDGGDAIRITGDTCGNNSARGLSGFIIIADPLNTSTKCTLYGQLGYHNNSNKAVAISFVGSHETNTPAINNIKIQFSSGNIVSGTFTLYGRKN